MRPVSSSSHQKLDGVTAGEQLEGSVVLDGLVGQLRGGFTGHADVGLVADVGDGSAVFVFHFTDEFDDRALRAAFARQRQLAAWNLSYHWDKVLGGIELEIVDLHGDGDLGHGVGHHQGVLQLAFHVRGSEIIKGLVGDVSHAVIQLSGGIFLERDLNAAKLAVEIGIGGVVTNDVVTGNGFLGFDDAAGEIVWSRIFVDGGKLKADIGRARAIELPRAETERLWQITTPQWPVMHAVLYGVTRDQLMARHKSNHIQVAYAPDAAAANLALASKAAMFREMGLEVAICGTDHGL